MSTNDKESTNTTNNNKHENDDDIVELEHHPIVIVGGGIGGLVLALCLDQVYNHPTTATEHQQDGSSTTNSATTTTTTTRRRSRLPIHVYESTSAYTNNAGGAIGLYFNGLRVLKHLSKTHPALSNILINVRNAGCDYVYRRWMRHDGLEVAVAREDELLPYDSSEFVMCDNDNNDDKEEESSEAQPRRITEVNEKSSSSDEEDDESTAKDENEKVDHGKEELQEYEVPTKTNDGDSGNNNNSSSSSSRPRGDSISSNHSQQRRPRGDSIASQDKEGERADRRPKGGSIGSLQHVIQNLSKRSLLGNSNVGNSASARSLVSNSSADNVVDYGGNNKNDTNSNDGDGGGRPRSNSGRSMRDLLTSLGSSAKDITATLVGERISGISTSTNGSGSTPARGVGVDSELLSLGIRRWKYQEVLYNACLAAGVHVHFGKRLQTVTSISSSKNDNNKLKRCYAP